MYYFIYPSKDSYIYELNTNSEKNFGGDNNLVLKKEFDGTSLKGVSRVLLHFDLTELSQSLVSNEITTSLDGNGVPPKYYLRLYEQKTSELSPEYSLATFPLSSSWEDGTGYTTQDPNSRNGVSWVRRDESFDNTNWVENLGTELIPDPSFIDSVWEDNANASLGGAGDTDTITIDNDAGSVYSENDILTAGNTYKIVIDGTISANTLNIGSRNAAGNTQVHAEGFGTHYFTTRDTYGVRLHLGATGAATIDVTSISLKEVFGGISAESGSRSTGGGVWYINSDTPINSGSAGIGECSQSFSYESPDVNMDVTDIVNNWLDGTIPNNGLILKWSGSQEDSSTETGNINFFSADANSIYSPKIEVRWDEHTNNYTGTFEDYDEEFNESGGSFEYPDVPIEPITIDGTDDNYMFMIGLRKTYKETEKPRFRVAGRERYQTKTVTTTKTTQKNKLIPQGSGSYSIIDVETGETLIPFGEHSILSTDILSNYFKLKLDGFINKRLYRILLRLKLNDGRYRIFDDGFDFKVIS